MTIGITDTFTQSRDEIISDALANVGAIGPGETATGDIRAHAARALNRIVKAIDAEGQFLWRISRQTFQTTAGTAAAALITTAFDVDEPISYMASTGTSRVPLRPMSRDDYMSLPDRTTTGTPVRYFIEKTLSGGRVTLMMYLWPVPAASGDTVEYAAAVRSADFTNGATTPDFPSNWTTTLVYGLTAEIAAAYNALDVGMQARQLYEAEKSRQLSNDNEKQGIFFVPWGSG